MTVEWVILAWHLLDTGFYESQKPEADMIQFLASTLFWDRKVRIGILALATFAALC